MGKIIDYLIIAIYTIICGIYITKATTFQEHGHDYGADHGNVNAIEGGGIEDHLDKIDFILVALYFILSLLYTIKGFEYRTKYKNKKIDTSDYIYYFAIGGFYAVISAAYLANTRYGDKYGDCSINPFFMTIGISVFAISSAKLKKTILHNKPNFTESTLINTLGIAYILYSVKQGRISYVLFATLYALIVGKSIYGLVK
jgi:preprotein translocase subunit SecG